MDARTQLLKAAPIPAGAAVRLLEALYALTERALDKITGGFFQRELPGKRTWQNIQARVGSLAAELRRMPPQTHLTVQKWGEVRSAAFSVLDGWPSIDEGRQLQDRQFDQLVATLTDPASYARAAGQVAGAAAGVAGGAAFSFLGGLGVVPVLVLGAGLGIYVFRRELAAAIGARMGRVLGGGA
jgi:hypothetical protein